MSQEIVKLNMLDEKSSFIGKISCYFAIALKISYIIDFNLHFLVAPTPEDNYQVKEE